MLALEPKRLSLHFTLTKALGSKRIPYTARRAGLQARAVSNSHGYKKALKRQAGHKMKLNSAGFQSARTEKQQCEPKQKMVSLDSSFWSSCPTTSHHRYLLQLPSLLSQAASTLFLPSKGNTKIKPQESCSILITHSSCHQTFNSYCYLS